MIADMFDVFFFDLDGVVYIGGRATPGAASTLDRLRGMGKAIRFLTNNPTTRSEIADRLRWHGIKAEIGEIITAGSATADYLAGEGIVRAWVVGEPGLRREVEMAGVLPAGEEDCEAVVLGWDDSATLLTIRKAALAVRRGARFVSTNVDRTYPSPEGPIMSVGALAEAIRIGSGKDPVIVGKPFEPMFRDSLSTVDSPPSRVAMIGDTPEIDILGAHRAGITAILMGDARAPEEGFARPDARIVSLPELFDPSASLSPWTPPPTE